jgi:hypothetical protein
MGGALRLESSGPAGSVFRVELRGAESPLRALEDTGTFRVADAPHREATLLYVEDNLANLSLVETILLSRPGGAPCRRSRGSSAWSWRASTCPTSCCSTCTCPTSPATRCCAACAPTRAPPPSRWWW